MGSKPTGVSTEKRPPTLSGMMKDFVAFVVGRYAGSALFGIGDGNDNLLCHILAALVFALLFQQTERQGRFSGSTGFGDVDNTEFLVFQVFGEFI